MTVFKAYLKVLNKNKALVILYTAILICFAGFNMKTNDIGSFRVEKPKVLIVNQDENYGITASLIQYITKNSTIVKIKENDSSQNDALFYRDVSYIIYLPKNFRNDFLSGKSPKIEVKSTGDYNASLASMMLERYLKVASTYLKIEKNEVSMIKMIDETLDHQVDIEMTSKLDSDHLMKVANFYNFANYSLLAGCVFVICFVIASFKDEKIQQRTMVSSLNMKKYNQQLLFANGLFAFTLWILYVLLSFLLVGNSMFDFHGLLFMMNSFVFMVVALTFALLIGSVVRNKEAIGGIVNVVALGSSFLCGAFVPMEWLPDFVLKIAHVLPSYYYISNNNFISKLEPFGSLNPMIFNIVVLLLFGVIFIIITNIVSKRK